MSSANRSRLVPDNKGVALYHVVYKNEGFEPAARVLFELVRHAEEHSPGQPRYLYLDIEGHRNSVGGFDADMMELQQEFVLGYLVPYLTEAHVPLVGVSNPNPQWNDIPDGLEIRQNMKTKYLFTLPHACPCGARHPLFIKGEPDADLHRGATYQFPCPVKNIDQTFPYDPLPGEDLPVGEYLKEGEEYPPDAVPVKRIA